MLDAESAKLAQSEVWKLSDHLAETPQHSASLIRFRTADYCADEEKPILKKDDANFPWGIGGISRKLLVSERRQIAIAP